MVWPRADDLHFCHTSRVPFKISIRHFSECCFGYRKSPFCVLRHPCSDPWVAHFCHTSLLIFTFSNCVISLWPPWSSKSFKNDRFYKHSWSSWFLVGSTDFHNCSYFQGYIQFLLRRWILENHIFFRIVVFPKENHTFCCVHEFNVLDQFSKSSYFQRYTQNLTRRRIHWVRLYFRIVVFPKENHTFWCVDGFVL